MTRLSSRFGARFPDCSATARISCLSLSSFRVFRGNSRHLHSCLARQQERRGTTKYTKHTKERQGREGWSESSVTRLSPRFGARFPDCSATARISFWSLSSFRVFRVFRGSSRHLHSCLARQQERRGTTKYTKHTKETQWEKRLEREFRDSPVFACFVVNEDFAVFQRTMRSYSTFG